MGLRPHFTIMVGPSTRDKLYDDLQETSLWGNIRRAAKTDEELKRMLEEVKLYYLLKYAKSK